MPLKIHSTISDLHQLDEFHHQSSVPPCDHVCHEPGRLQRLKKIVEQTAEHLLHEQQKAIHDPRLLPQPPGQTEEQLVVQAFTCHPPHRRTGIAQIDKIVNIEKFTPIYTKNISCGYRRQAHLKRIRYESQDKGYVFQYYLLFIMNIATQCPNLINHFYQQGWGG